MDGLKKKNPGALAGATGAAFGKAIFKTETYRNRAASATRLCAAIAECDRDDAVFIMSAALADLRAGSPVPHLLAIEAEAASWASFAAPFELLAYLRACLDRLGDDALKVNARKALLVRLWRALPVADQRAFLRRVDPSGAIQGAAQ
ncbi:hypothetical protein GCM10011345_07940 [Gemmobacter megaterium]|uniref:hypothetical protein n=1 Tax=Gemmobacter megaterium TaxID=1086013 RepID=UPI00199896CA|nr:hypothetical protein [Gemmobacter megaterium]GGE04858.1 hypothetical protein GCM10011345_07940 [Gemmobacter megaterium]